MHRTRLSIVLFHIIHLCTLNSALAQLSQDESLHKWTDLSGKFSITAKVDSWTENKVKLLRDDGGTSDVPINKLSREDRDFLTAWIHLSNTANHEQDYLDLVSKAPSYPQDALDDLIKIHDEDEDVVSGLLWSSMVATSAAIKQLDDADRVLKETVLRLRNLRKHFPDKHTLTLVSALNNSAVISLRESSSSRACSLLVEASELTGEVHYVVNHNLNILHRQVQNGNPLFRVTGTNSKRLKAASGLKAQDFLGLQPPEKFLYSSQYDSSLQPTSQPVPKDLKDALKTLLIWPELTCFFCKGSGFRDCANCVGGLESYKKQVIVNYSPRKEPIYQERIFTRTCSACSGKGGFICKECDHGRVGF